MKLFFKMLISILLFLILPVLACVWVIKQEQHMVMLPFGVVILVSTIEASIIFLIIEYRDKRRSKNENEHHNN